MFRTSFPAGDPEGDLLIVSWGSTYRRDHPSGKGAARQGPQDRPPASAPPESIPGNLGEVLKRYKQGLVPEMNMGQLSWMLRAKYLVDAIG